MQPPDFASVQPPPGFLKGPCVGGKPGRTLVFAGIDANGAPCALKTIDPTAVGNALVEARWEAERLRHVQCNGCAGVVRAVVIGNWLVTSWAHGGDFAEWGERKLQNGRLNESELLHIVVNLLESCRDMHARGVVHRDIKPSNMLRDGDAMWLTDFGVAAVREPDGTWRSLPEPWVETEVGSPGWVAPELVTPALHTSTANDIYSVGRVWKWLAQNATHESSSHVTMRRLMLHDDAAQRPSAVTLLRELGI